MKQKSFTPAYARQFKPGNIILPGATRHNYFLHKQIAGSRTDIPLIEGHFTKVITHLPEIKNLINALENQTYPNCSRVINYSQRMIKKFSSSPNNESATADNFTRLLNVLRLFIPITIDYKNNIIRIEELLKNYEDGYGRYVTARTAGIVLTIMVRDLKVSLNEMHSYCDEFNSMLREEECKLTAKKVTTQVEQELIKLINFLENSMADTESKLTKLNKLKRSMAHLEVQELYN